MRSRQDIISEVLIKKQERLAEKIKIKEKKQESLKTNNADYKKICDEIKMIGSRLALVALSGNKTEINKLKERLNTLNTAKEEMLKSADIKDIEYDCPLCKDKGITDDKLCSCVKKEADEICLAELNKIAPSESCHFHNFDLSFYEDKKAKDRMTAIFTSVKDYAEKFDDNTKENLLFTGNTGLGKTHLSLAVANKVITKGKSVIYSPAYNLFGQIETEHFKDHTDKTYKDATETDLLIIDDLGGEFVSPFVLSVVYNIINTRINSSKPTIISTNLDFEELEKRYTPRVVSRLIGEYEIKQFLGRDIRLAKKLGKK